jgi:ATP-dependent DNA helicase RecG
MSEQGTDRVTEKVTENQQKILDLMSRNKYITVLELSGIMNISRKSVLANIATLKKKALLNRIGPAKGGYWEIVK